MLPSDYESPIDTAGRLRNDSNNDLANDLPSWQNELVRDKNDYEHQRQQSRQHEIKRGRLRQDIANLSRVEESKLQRAKMVQREIELLREEIAKKHEAQREIKMIREKITKKQEDLKLIKARAERARKQRAELEKTLRAMPSSGVRQTLTRRNTYAYGSFSGDDIDHAIARDKNDSSRNTLIGFIRTKLEDEELQNAAGIAKSEHGVSDRTSPSTSEKSPIRRRRRRKTLGGLMTALEEEALEKLRESAASWQGLDASALIWRSLEEDLDNAASSTDPESVEEPSNLSKFMRKLTS